jgi:molybdopterin-guanine dinucleotide biosynthesis protein A
VAREPDGRLANVAAAVLCDERAADSAVAAVTLLSEICEDVLVLGANPPIAMGRSVPAKWASPLGRLVAALEAARAERLLVVDAVAGCPRAELVLALTAWPESDVVVPNPHEDDAPACAMYRREPVLTLAQARLAAGETDLSGLLRDVEVSEITVADLVPLEVAAE